MLPSEVSLSRYYAVNLMIFYAVFTLAHTKINQIAFRDQTKCLKKGFGHN